MYARGARAGELGSIIVRVWVFALRQRGGKTDDGASLFGAVAEDYDRYRPELPEAVLDWLLPSGCRVALDLGAGTGSATRVLARRAPQVIAVEPDPRMRALIAGRAPEAEVLEGPRDFIGSVLGESGEAMIAVPMACRCWKAVRI